MDSLKPLYSIYFRWLSPFTCILSLLLSCTGCTPPVPEERDLLIATATTGGTFYPVGVAIATLVSQQEYPEQPILMSAITSAGSAENVAMLKNNEAQLAILQALFASMAWQGTDLYQKRPVTNLRGMAMLWENVEQIVVTRQLVKNGTVDDLRNTDGRRISLGSRWSGSEISASTILRVLGIDAGRDYDAVHLGYGPSADALANRRIDGFFLGAGIPTGAIMQAYAGLGSDHVAMLSFTDEHLLQLRERYPVWNRFVIPADTYPGQSWPIATLSQPNVLVTTAEVDDEVIYQILKTIWSNLNYLHRQHAATRAMSLANATRGLPLPLHSGAVRFYREAGVDIPDSLIPQEMKDHHDE